MDKNYLAAIQFGPILSNVLVCSYHNEKLYPVAKSVRYTPYIEKGQITDKDNMSNSLKEMLSEIKQAKLVSCVNDGTTMYHVVLELKNGDSLTIFNSSSSVRPEHEKNAEAINNFLKGGHKEMILKDSFVFGGIILIIFGITIFAVGGGLSSLFSVIETID